jgi:hypothetical protein
MKRIVAVFSVVSWICPLWAQQGSTAAASSTVPPSFSEVMHFYDVMQVRQQLPAILDAEQKQIRIVINEMFAKSLPNASPAQKKQIDELVDGMVNDIFKDYPTENILRDMVPVYQKHLTESDLNAVIAFYSSPVGQKIRREMPMIMAEGMRVSYASLQPRIDQMMKNVQTRIDKMSSDSGSDRAEPKQ